jgi:uncharacterized repeat protein (TIGR01451 family)
MVKRSIIGCLVAAIVFSSSVAQADMFAQGSLIVPMDTTYQDNGMLKAFGLVYDLLRNGVPVQWVIREDKAHLGADFTTTAIDHRTGAVIPEHGYRGGPWVIDSKDAAKAIPIIDAWQVTNPTVAVHEVAAPFWGDVSRSLIVAPTIAMHQDGNEKIARSYLQAAGIPDSTLDPTWPVTSPDMLTPAEVAGPTTSNHRDGKLFDADGDPVYCQFMSMHWGTNEAAASPETVLEVREYLKHPVHFFAECQAVNAFEGAPPAGGRGNFLANQGFQWPAPDQPKTYEFFNDSSPYAQLDGAFQSVGGSEPAYSLAAGSEYHVGGVVMIKKAGTIEGDSDIWMTGFLDGACNPDVEYCENNYGKVSYLGGHQYPTNLPISKNPQTQGTRLFLNSLFEAPCATWEGQPDTSLVKSGPLATTSAIVTYTVEYLNSGSGVATSGVISDQLPAGASFVSASSGYVLNGRTVTWSIGNLGSRESGQVTLTIQLSGHGTYANTAHLGYKVGLNSFSRDSNTTSTVYDADTDSDGIVDSLDTCPSDYNPAQNLLTDSASCGGCGIVCSASHGTPTCKSGLCAIGTCQSGFSDCDGSYSTGCEHIDTGQPCCDCTPAHGTGACIAGACAISGCSSGFSDCDKAATNGCEYDNASFSTDPNHCGSCNVKCAFANAEALCVAGTCQMGVCSGAYVDSDGAAANGCECHKLATSDMTCDAVDDDCNGLIDDAYAPTSCGIGACAAKSRCATGEVVPCSIGPASTEGPAGDTSCEDGADNDCDGLFDAADINCAASGGAAGSGGLAGASSVGGIGTTGGTAGTPLGGSAGTSGGSDGIALGGVAGSTGTPLGGSDGTDFGGSDASGGLSGLTAGGPNAATVGGSTAPTLGGLGGNATTPSSGASTGRTSGGTAQIGGATLVGTSGSIPTSTNVGSSSDGVGEDGGCGCKLVSNPQNHRSTGAILLGLGYLVFRRRRRHSQTA